MFSNKVKRPLILLLALSVAGWVFAAEPEGETPSVNTAPLRGETMDAMSNRHVHPFNGQTVDGVFADTEGFSKVAQSDGAELWLNEAFGTVRIKNLKTGYIWGALPAEANAEGLNKTWTSYGNSIAAIECYDEAGVERRYGLSESAQTTFTMTDGGFICHANFSELGISFDTRVALQENKLTFSIPEESITEGTDGKTFTLKSVSFLPYLGAVYGDTMDGYLLIPDGPGALIRFRKPANYSSTYDKKIYGFDLGIESLAVPSDIKAFRPNDYAVDERQIVMPVYGIVHGAGQNGLLMVVEDGDLYASITATPAISNNPYNRVTARFEYRQKYSKNINRKEGAGVFTPQEHRNELSPSLSVYILDGNSAHYDGMAVLYRERLQNEGILTSVEPQSSIPLRLEVLGADKKRQFFKTSTEIFTDVDRAEAIVSSLAADGVTNLSLVYRCFSKNNEAGQPILNCVGTAAGFAGLADRLNAQGGRFSLYLDPLSANADQITLRTEAANTLSNMVIKQTRPNNSVMYPDTYFYRLEEAEQRVARALGYGNFTFAVDQLSFRLYGDFTSGNESTRAQNYPRFIGMAEQLSGGGKIPMYQPNQHMWRYTSEFYDAPLVGSQLLYESDTVPFLHIVLSGSAELFGSSLNIGTFSTGKLLRHIEYGVYPSFIVAGCDSLELYRTAQEDFYSTNFEDWEPYILEAYRTVGGALAPLRGRSMTAHTAVADGFIRVTYDDGTRVYVNYTDKPMTDGNVTVDAIGYAVVNAG